MDGRAVSMFGCAKCCRKNLRAVNKAVNKVTSYHTTKKKKHSNVSMTNRFLLVKIELHPVHFAKASQFSCYPWRGFSKLSL